MKVRVVITDRAWCRLYFPRSGMKMREALKRLRPERHRRYYPAREGKPACWGLHLPKLPTVLKLASDTVTELAMEGEPPEYLLEALQQDPRVRWDGGVTRGQDEDYWTLWLLPGAPRAIVTAARRILLAKYHPDSGEASAAKHGEVDVAASRILNEED